MMHLISRFWHRWQGWLKIVGTVILLAYLLNKMPAAEMWQQVLQLSPASLFISFLILLLSNLFFAVAWAIALHYLDFDLPIQTVSKLFFQSLFINNFASFIGGDSLRVVQVGRSSQRILEATVSVFLSRFAMLYAILLLAGFMAWGWGPAVGWGNQAKWIGGFLTIFLLLAIPILAILSRMSVKKSVLLKIEGKSNWVTLLIARFGHIGSRLHGHEHIFLLILLVSLLAQILSTLAVWTLAVAMKMPVHWWQLLLFLSIIGVALILPISFNGIGIREVGLVGLLTSIQIDGAQALALSLSTSLLVIVTSFVGGISLLIDFVRGHAQDRNMRLFSNAEIRVKDDKN